MLAAFVYVEPGRRVGRVVRLVRGAQREAGHDKRGRAAELADAVSAADTQVARPASATNR